VRARARLSADLDPRVVVGEHGWWQACAELGLPGYDPFSEEGASFNLLIGSAVRDPISGTASHRASLCEVRPAARGSRFLQGQTSPPGPAETHPSPGRGVR
jgi:hypothetical protein